MENLLFDIAFAAYSVAVALSLVYLFTKRDAISTGALVVWTTAILVHLASLGLRCVHQNHAWSTWYATLSLFAIIAAVLYAVISFAKPMPVLGAFVTPIPWLLLSYARLHRGDLETTSSQIFRTWLAIHIPIAFTAYALLAMAFAVGIAYWIQEQQIKSKRPSELAYRLPSLQEMDRLIMALVMAATPLLLLALTLGALWAKTEWGRFWSWDPKETSTLLLCLFYVVYLFRRVVLGWQGRRSVYWSMAGFVLMLFTYAGANYLSPLHGFLSAAGH